MTTDPTAPPWLWIACTIAAAAAQTFRNAMQRELTGILGTVGATHVRFLFGLPFGVLFLGVILLISGWSLPHIPLPAVGWTAFGAIAQILATGLMLAAMRHRSFVVAVVFTKSEPIQVATFGFLVLGDAVTPLMGAAIVLATAGVVLLSRPKDKVAPGQRTWQGPAMGLAAGGLFAIASVGFRAGIQALGASHFLLGASTILALSLLIQAATLTAWLLATTPEVLGAIWQARRRSIFAGFMGALASQMWFLAFAIQSAARVRTLALVEILFTLILSRRLFAQRLSTIEAAGILLVVGGILLLLRA